jgi:hypothetical protein
MKVMFTLTVIMTLFACAASPPSNDGQTASEAANQTAPQNEPDASNPPKPVKSPHGYVIDKDYDLGRFGGFVGDCTDDQNWPHYWQCMSENAGNGGFH